MIFPSSFDSKKSLNLYFLFENFEFLKNLYIEKKFPKVLMLSGKKGSGKATLISHLMYYIFDRENYSEKIYIKTIIQGKNISRNLNFEKKNLNSNDYYEQVLVEIKKELINLIKSKNLIDIRTPSFLNVKLDINKLSSLVDLDLIVKNIDLIENIYVQEFNKDYMKLRIKYLGKLDKIINQLKLQNIHLKLINDQWIIKSL